MGVTVVALSEHEMVMQWVALFDTVDRLVHDDRSYQGNARVTADAFAALYAYEHTLSPPTLLLARETLWRRDFPATSLPVDRHTWAWCQCRSCVLTRRIERARRVPSVIEAQHAIRRKQRQS